MSLKWVPHPDLPRRFGEGQLLMPGDDMTYWHNGGAKGYVDYPVGA